MKTRIMTFGKLTKAIMDDFTTHFVPNAKCLYLRDTKDGMYSCNRDKLKALDFDMSQESKMPDVILYSKDKDWLYLVDSITSGRAINEARFEELTILTKRVKKVKVLVTAFPDFHSFKDNVEKLAWDTVAWIAEAPEHLIHLEKEGTLEPR